MPRPIKYGYVSENEYLMSMWDYDKNASLGIHPEAMSCCNNAKVWWKCPICHNSWLSRVSHIFNGSNCPYCKKMSITKDNSLGYLLPELASEIISPNIDPMNIFPFSSKIVQWKCKNCGHIWSSTISNRVRNNACPCCKHHMFFANIHYKNSLDNCDTLKKEWDYSKNKIYDLKCISIFSTYKYWWKCATCGYTWQESVYKRLSQGLGCPMCDKRLKETTEQKLWY